MSFADQIREELCECQVKKNCCRRALAAGFLLTATRQDATHVALRLRHANVAYHAADLLSKIYSKEPQVKESGSHGHMYYDLSLSAASAAKLVTSLQSEGCDPDELLKLSACDGCRSAFLRGVFLATGTVSDPQKVFHLELLLPTREAAQLTASVLESAGYPPKTVKRRTQFGLYYKVAETVGDLVTYMGGHTGIYAFYNASIAREIRNNENRATNCVARNIERSISASARQIEAIGRLMEHGRLDALPEPLRVTALLRYRNPDATLDELRELHEPPISKSGLCHRLQKLCDAADHEITRPENTRRHT